MSTPSQHQRVGELRTSQLLHTFGIGAVVDLPNLSVIVRGLQEWNPAHSTVLRENRLLELVQKKLGKQVTELRTPPYTPPNLANPFEEWARIGVPVSVFPRWLRCTWCRVLASADSGLFELLPDVYRPDRVRYVHSCQGQGRKRPSAVPARFVLACREGHLDDFPWMYFVHKGAEPTEGEHQLKLTERGTSGETANVFAVCGCGERRPMSDAFGEENAAKNLPGCRGRHPHLGTFNGCGLPTRTMSLGATNGWFPTQIPVFSLPEGETGPEDEVARNWDVLATMAALPKERARPVIVNLAFWPELEPHGFESVWEEMQRRHAAGESLSTAADPDEEPDVEKPEWEAFTRSEPVNLADFTTQKVSTPRNTTRYLERVILVPRLREVRALYGFTRIDAPEYDVFSTEASRVAALSADPPTWVPCAEQRGEGIFLKFREEPLAAWEASPAVKERERYLRAGHDAWRSNRRLQPGEWPGMRYVLLHSLAHCLIREFALESGYGASGIAERIYARGGTDAMAGILLYTAAPDSEGTLGGLVSLGEQPERLGGLFDQALDAARLCSSDPLCAEHDPMDHARLYGAACHVCLFASETSCVRNNYYLDRTLLVETMASGDQKGLGYFE
ncbi:DUF1998 domain-containing protein [Nocardiopsis sp. LDBS0036]|uniref:DrmB family protein n=1 Tax=Nocardiopsis sp. LDBS0036 TaxID=3104276 RepID=UPI0035161457